MTVIQLIHLLTDEDIDLNWEVEVLKDLDCGTGSIFKPAIEIQYLKEQKTIRIVAEA